jgi:hypothetical protein
MSYILWLQLFSFYRKTLYWRLKCWLDLWRSTYKWRGPSEFWLITNILYFTWWALYSSCKTGLETIPDWNVQVSSVFLVSTIFMFVKSFYCCSKVNWVPLRTWLLICYLLVLLNLFFENFVYAPLSHRMWIGCMTSCHRMLLRIRQNIICKVDIT